VGSPAPQFTGLSEAEIMAALNDPDPSNPIAVRAVLQKIAPSHHF
jgi:hypothetical protein